MKIKNLLFFIILGLFVFSTAFAQEDDSTETHHHNWFHWDRDSDLFDISIHGDPTLSFNYGLSKITLKNSSDKFADPKLLEFKIGYTRESEKFEAENIFNYKYRYLTLGYISSELGNSSSGLQIDTKLWRVGLIKSSGYGYEIGNAAVILYNSSGMMWSRPEVHRPNILTFAAVPQNKMDDINESIRFGTSAEGGIRFETGKIVTLEAGYERSIIFPRHLFGKWVISAILEDIAQSFVDRFVDEIFDSSPQVAPVVSFVLKNALSYGIYELRQDKMNWPFNTEPGIGYDQFKFGVTFVF
ncbi:MAG TPA: hypothetical protein VKA26_05000 [Ignavibacteriaceae bacterium]|nr:hypothetical protein [Ignavibacteriaceae bacterium]